MRATLDGLLEQCESLHKRLAKACISLGGTCDENGVYLRNFPPRMTKNDVFYQAYLALSIGESEIYRDKTTCVAKFERSDILLCKLGF